MPATVSSTVQFLLVAAWETFLSVDVLACVQITCNHFMSRLFLGVAALCKPLECTFRGDLWQCVQVHLDCAHVTVYVSLAVYICLDL